MTANATERPFLHLSDHKEWVVDASVALKWYLPEMHRESALQLLDPRFRLHVPEFLLIEVAQVLWKTTALRRELKPKEGQRILQALLDIPFVVYPVAPLLESALTIALHTERTVYDSVYLALATSLDCPLITADEKFWRALQNGPFGKGVVWLGEV